MSSILGIDLGNKNCLVTLPSRGGVDVLSNQESKRLTATMVAFDERRRFSGIFAHSQQSQNISGTIKELKRLVGLRYNSPEREAIQAIVPFTLVEQPNGFVGVKVSYKGNETVFTIEQCLAYLIESLFEIAKRDNSLCSEVVDCVVVVAPWWDECQRRVLMDAAEIAGRHVVRTLNSTTAAAITYAMYHRRKLPEKIEDAVPVMVVDYGDSSLNVAVVQLYQGSVEVKSFACDNHLGGQNFTHALMDYLVKKVQEKYKVNPYEKPRAAMRFREAVERLKHGLSINPVMCFEVQNLMNDVDVMFQVKREEFESQIGDLVERTGEPIKRALEHAGIEKEALFAIEVHGGASRVPAVKARITEILGREPTQSLNPDECFALGAGFQAAILSPKWKVDMTVKDVAPYRILVQYHDPKEDQVVEKELFSQFQVVPSTKVVKFKVVNTSQVKLGNENGQIGVVDIETGSDEMISVSLRIRMSVDGIIEVVSVTTLAVPPTEEGEDEQEGEKKPVPVPVNFIYKHDYGLSSDEIAEYHKQEKIMQKTDADEEAIDFVKNELESMLIKLQNGLSYDLAAYFENSEIEKITPILTEIQDWFSENEFERLSFDEYNSRLRTLKQLAGAGLEREQLHIRIPGILSEARTSVSKCLKSLADDSEQYSHITQKMRQPLVDDLESCLSLINEQQTTLETLPKHVTPTIDTAKLQESVTDLSKRTKRLLRTPPPKQDPPPPQQPSPPPSPEEPQNPKTSEEPQNQETPEPPVCT